MPSTHLPPQFRRRLQSGPGLPGLLLGNRSLLQWFSFVGLSMIFVLLIAGPHERELMNREQQYLRNADSGTLLLSSSLQQLSSSQDEGSIGRKPVERRSIHHSEKDIHNKINGGKDEHQAPPEMKQMSDELEEEEAHTVGKEARNSQDDDSSLLHKEDSKDVNNDINTHEDHDNNKNHNKINGDEDYDPTASSIQHTKKELEEEEEEEEEPSEIHNNKPTASVIQHSNEDLEEDDDEYSKAEDTRQEDTTLFDTEDEYQKRASYSNPADIPQEEKLPDWRLSVDCSPFDFHCVTLRTSQHLYEDYPFPYGRTEPHEDLFEWETLESVPLEWRWELLKNSSLQDPPARPIEYIYPPKVEKYDYSKCLTTAQELTWEEQLEDLIESSRIQPDKETNLLAFTISDYNYAKDMIHDFFEMNDQVVGFPGSMFMVAIDVQTLELACQFGYPVLAWPSAMKAKPPEKNATKNEVVSRQLLEERDDPAKEDLKAPVLQLKLDKNVTRKEVAKENLKAGLKAELKASVLQLKLPDKRAMKKEVPNKQPDPSKEELKASVANTKFELSLALVERNLDFFFYEMDVWFLKSPKKMLSLFEGDILLSSHQDCPMCINIGVYMVRANIRTKEYFETAIQLAKDSPGTHDQKVMAAILFMKGGIFTYGKHWKPVPDYVPQLKHPITPGYMSPHEVVASERPYSSQMAMAIHPLSGAPLSNPHSKKILAKELGAWYGFRGPSGEAGYYHRTNEHRRYLWLDGHILNGYSLEMNWEFDAYEGGIYHDMESLRWTMATLVALARRTGRIFILPRLMQGRGIHFMWNILDLKSVEEVGVDYRETTFPNNFKAWSNPTTPFETVARTAVGDHKMFAQYPSLDVDGQIETRAWKTTTEGSNTTLDSVDEVDAWWAMHSTLPEIDDAELLLVNPHFMSSKYYYPMLTKVRKQQRIEPLYKSGRGRAMHEISSVYKKLRWCLNKEDIHLEKIVGNFKTTNDCYGRGEVPY